MAQDANILTRALQTEALSADTDRLINDVLLEAGVVGVAGGSFQVAQDTGANLQVKVGSGAAGDKAVIKRDGRVYIIELQDATHTLGLAAADADDDRIDLIVARVYDDEADSSGNSYGDIEVIQGTPAASPTVPATPAGAIALASILVAEDSTAVTNGDITDLREEFIVRGQHVTTLVFATPGASSFDKADYPWLRKIRVRAQGGGGAGGGAAATGAGECSAGAGGQGGGFVEHWLSVDELGASETVTVGAGGTANLGASGGNGGASSFGSHVVAGGGGGGTTAASSATPNGVDGPNGVQTLTPTAALRTKGQGGGAAIRYTTIRALGGMGGSSAFGQGGGGTAASTGGSPGGFAGGGGGGAANTQSQSAQLGGAGGSGFVVLDLYA